MTETKETAVEKKEPTQSEKYTSMVMREFQGTTGTLALSEHQKKLAQHLFIKIDVQLQALETKRLDSNGQGLPIIWQNVNLPKLAIDSVHRIELGLDALIPNHIHPIPYFNKRMKKYDLDLRIGYEGKKYYKIEVALEKPLAVITKLIHSTDTFKPIMGDHITCGDKYEWIINNPFDRGDVAGGFGYLAYENSVKNELILVAPRDFERSKAKAKTQDFWRDNPEEMMYKTVVHRTMDKVPVDPEKVTAAYAAVEEDESRAIEAEFEEEKEENANKETLEIPETTPQADPETGEIQESEQGALPEW